MLGFKLFAFIVACVAVVAAVPAPTHKHKDCDRKSFWWGRKNSCIPYGGIHNAIAPPRRNCGRWYWYSNLGCCAPPQPDWSDPQCPPGWNWDDDSYSCVPGGPSVPGPVAGPGHCGSWQFWWGVKSCCLPSGGPASPAFPPNGYFCPNNWYWHGNGYCAPRVVGYSAPVCKAAYIWDAALLWCKRI